jgi:ribosomal protein S18 acetylase RimI-like enzyme
MPAGKGKVEQVGPGKVKKALAFLEEDPCRNVWVIFALRRYGVFNLGLPEQGAFYAHYGGSGGMEGLLYCNNLGFWRFFARSPRALSCMAGTALQDGRRPVSITGDPAVLERALALLERDVPEGLPPVAGREMEVVMRLARRALPPDLARGARPAEPGDVEEMVRLERALQLHLLGRSADRDFLRERVREVVERGRASVFPAGKRLAAKAELEIEAPGVSQLSGVFTRARYRRRGCAAAACALLCALAVGEGREVCLETQEDNAPALSLYRKLGFRLHARSLVVRFRA